MSGTTERLELGAGSKPDVHELCDANGYTIGYIGEGHVQPEMFIAKILFDGIGEGFEDQLKPEAVRHRWHHWGDEGPGGESECFLADGPAEGLTPCTLIEVQG